MSESIIVPLKTVIDAVESAFDGWSQFLDIKTMEIESLPDEDSEFFDVEYAELSEKIDEGWKTRYFTLPDKYDIHEYSIIQRFVYDLPEGRLQDELCRAIRGGGAFRRFKDTIRYYDMEQQWYDYRAQAYRQIAIDWCEVNGFEYSDEGSK